MLELMTFLDTFNWPTTLSGEGVAVILLAFFGVCYGLEQLFPHRKPIKRRGSYGTNLGLFAVNNTVLSLLSVSSLFLLAQHYAEQGLLRYINHPAAQMIVAFLVLDLLLYLWHRACHSFDGLWLFHRVHHNDPYLNTSTALRIHILELLITNLLKAGYVVLLGVDQLMMMVNEMLITLLTLFHHTNIAFKGEQWLGKLLIMPYLHRAHHSTERYEHDSNYGAALSVWDRLFGTLNEREPEAIGLNGHQPQALIGLFKLGFNIATPASVPQSLPVELEMMIAEAAYYRAEKRDFSPGYELLDWLEAKNDIFKLVYGHEPNQKKQGKYGLLVLG
ncbi:sterol desaturase family protein [Methylovulum psychrotolerans]|uniref:sterol desaturase family protein n=1 Tax=Methylovulum psychrotolerans TaxID=1704499 RepID=UPI001BFF0F7C|nr:sterol desaturase family protein [Methylovulum psychrotolerans]MBT9098549.1 sterol desaturase family protein [Methylovulum psychrotolerans]